MHFRYEIKVTYQATTNKSRFSIFLRGIQDGQVNSGRQVSHATNANEKHQAICGPSDMDHGYLSPRYIQVFVSLLQMASALTKSY